MRTHKFEIVAVEPIKWDVAALQATIDQVEFMHNATMMATDFYFDQVKKVREWQEHLWEIL